MLNLEEIFRDPELPENPQLPNSAVAPIASVSKLSSPWTTKAAALLTLVPDPYQRVALRRIFHEDANRAEFDSILNREGAERWAFELLAAVVYERWQILLPIKPTSKRIEDSI
jgi:hypothetical protein